MTTQSQSDAEQQAQRVAALLAATLYRAHCPPTETLLDYQLDRLATAQQRTVQKHLTLCPHCAAEVDDLALTDAALTDARRDVQADATAQLAHLLERLRTLFPGRPLLHALDQLPTAPALALRGQQADSNATHQFLYRADAYRLSLSVSAAFPSSAGYQLEGSVIDERDPTHVLAGRVHLLHNENVVQQVDIDEFGYFSLDDVASDRYTLLVELSQHSLWIQELDVS